MASRPKRLSDLPLEKKIEELLANHYTNSKDSDGHSTTVAVPDYLLPYHSWILDKMPEFRSRQAVTRDCVHIGTVIRVQQIEEGAFESEFEVHQLTRIMEAYQAKEQVRVDFLAKAPEFIRTATTNEAWDKLNEWLEQAKGIYQEWGGAHKMNLGMLIGNLEGTLENAKRGGWEAEPKLAVVRDIGYSDERYEEMFGDGS